MCGTIKNHSSIFLLLSMSDHDGNRVPHCSRFFQSYLYISQGIARSGEDKGILNCPFQVSYSMHTTNCCSLLFAISNVPCGGIIIPQLFHMRRLGKEN